MRWGLPELHLHPVDRNRSMTLLWKRNFEESRVVLTRATGICSSRNSGREVVGRGGMLRNVARKTGARRGDSECAHITSRLVLQGIGGRTKVHGKAGARNLVRSSAGCGVNWASTCPSSTAARPPGGMYRPRLRRPRTATKTYWKSACRFAWCSRSKASKCLMR
jgi:hypothetical protein